MKHTAPLLFLTFTIVFGCIQKHDGIDRSEKRSHSEDPPITVVPQISEDSLLVAARVKSRRITEEDEPTEYTIEFFDEKGRQIKTLSHYEGNYYNGDYLDEYSYDENDSLTLEKRTNPNGSSYERHNIFEGGFRMFRVLINDSNQRDTIRWYNYNDQGQRTQMLEKDWNTIYTYDNDGLLMFVRMKELGQGTDLMNMSELYMYNDKGWRISSSASVNSILGGQTNLWEYDDQGRVLILTVKSSLGVNHRKEYSYNEYGLISKIVWTKNSTGIASDYVEDETIVTNYEYEYYSK